MEARTAGSLAALVPCHRSPPGESLLRRLVAHADRVLLVDDGMSGRHAEALERAAAQVAAEVVHLPHGGKGHAIVAGLRRLEESGGAAAVVILDSDGQHPPEAIPRFVEASARADLVIGDRFGSPAGVPRLRLAANRVASRLLSLTTHTHVPDSQCGMRLLTRRALTEIPFPQGGFEAETVHLRRCLRAGVPVAWVAIPAVYEGGPSSFRPVRDSLAVLGACLRDPSPS
jgi:glycosyltransferase involved in cell wall biosynthesis